MSVLIKGMEMPKVATRLVIFADGRVEDEDDSDYKYSAISVTDHGWLCNECLCHMCENKNSCGVWEGNTKWYCENVCRGDVGCMTQCSQYSPSKGDSRHYEAVEPPKEEA